MSAGARNVQHIDVYTAPKVFRHFGNDLFAQLVAEGMKGACLAVVRAVGVEPTRRCHRGILSPLRLPVPPRPLYSGDQVLSAFTGEVELG